MNYKIAVKGCISIGGRKFIGGETYSEKELGNMKHLKGLVVEVEEEKEETMSIDELKDFIKDLSVEEMETMLDDEKKGSNRKGAISLIEGKIKELKDV
jgi:CxxC motif-containing protein